MRSRPHTAIQLSYAEALELWSNHQQEKTKQRLVVRRKPRGAATRGLVRQLGVARAKEWAAETFGADHHLATNDEEVDTPLFDISACHLSASKADLRFHLRQALLSIGLEPDLPAITASHPVVKREHLLLLLRFNSASVPTKDAFADCVRIYAIHLRGTTDALDRHFDGLDLSPL